MTPADFRRIRKAAGLTIAGLARVLRVSDEKTIRRYEAGERALSGPVAIIMEMMDAGELPNRLFAPAYSGKIEDMTEAEFTRRLKMPARIVDS